MHQDKATVWSSGLSLAGILWYRPSAILRTNSDSTHVHRCSNSQNTFVLYLLQSTLASANRGPRGQTLLVPLRQAKAAEYFRTLDNVFYSGRLPGITYTSPGPASGSLLGKLCWCRHSTLDKRRNDVVVNLEPCRFSVVL